MKMVKLTDEQIADIQAGLSGNVEYGREEALRIRKAPASDGYDDGDIAEAAKTAQNDVRIAGMFDAAASGAFDELEELVTGLAALFNDARYYRIDEFGSADSADEYPDEHQRPGVADIEAMRRHERTLTLAVQLLGPIPIH